MNEHINQRVSVLVSYNSTTGAVIPQKMKWNARLYAFTKLAYHHKKKVGSTLLHIFDLTDGQWDFRLICNTDSMHWILAEVADGNPE